MVRKCSVGGCKTNYDNKKAEQSEIITIYSFPKNADERAQWLASLPNKIDPERITENFGVCAKHFPPGTPMVRRGRYFVPAAPPSVFYNVPQSCIPTPPSQPRPTTKSSSEARAVNIDEMTDFLEIDKFGQHTDFISALKAKCADYGLVISGDKLCFYVLSCERKGPVHSFSLYCSIVLDSKTGTVSNLKCELYRHLKLVCHPNFRQNSLVCWSQFDKVIRFLAVQQEEQQNKKEKFLLQQIHIQNLPRNSRLYKVDDLCLGLAWCTRSRSLYCELRNYLQLPALTTLARITRTVKNTSSESLYRSVFDNLEERRRNCIIILDEIYVKASLTYRGREVFGHAVDQPEKKATTLLCIMVKCMFGGPKFLAKLLPCAGLTASFQFTAAVDLITALEKCGATVNVIINDNNRLNQSFFRMFKPMNSEKPWIVLAPSSKPLFLMYDPVHLVKNIRNNWITEPTKTICLPFQEGSVSAKWSDLQELYNTEAHSSIKLSKLTKASVGPSNLEKQKVSLALNVFCDETSTALKTSTSSTESWKSTALFIDIVNKLWKLFFCKSPYQEERRRDPDRVAIDLGESGQRGLQTLTHWAILAESLKPKSTPRMKSFTKDTSEALVWTCKCLVDLSNYLLTSQASNKHNYVCLGFFLQDDLERQFGYFRMSAGSNYYLTVQEVIQMHSKDQARLMLKNTSDGDLDIYSNNSHQCQLCDKSLTDSELLLIDDMLETGYEITVDEKQALFYISGYLAFKHPELAGSPAASHQLQSVQAYLEEMNRGGLTYPSDELFTFVVLAYSFYRQTPEQCCRNRLTTIFNQFPTIFHLEGSFPLFAIRRLVNIVMKRFCLHDGQEGTRPNQQSRKIAKLTSKSS